MAARSKARKRALDLLYAAEMRSQSPIEALESAVADVEVDESCANFVLARLGSEAAAEAADRHFKAAGIILRRVAGYGFPDGLRITVGRPPDVTRVLDTMAAFEVPA